MVGHGVVVTFDEVLEVVSEPGVVSEDEGRSGLEEAFQGEMVFTLVHLVFLSFEGRHFWYCLIKSSA